MSGLFGASSTSKPTLSLGTTSTANIGGSSLFGNRPAFGGSISTSNINNPNPTQIQNQNTQPTTITSQPATSGSGPQIDVAHLRSTTKFDHLVPLLASEIEKEEVAIENQQQHCREVSQLLPAVVQAGKQIAPAIEYVSAKLEELELGLENDAEAIVALRDGEVKKDEGEVKCVFRAVDRLKVPRQYQIGHTADMNLGQSSGPLGISGGSGLSGWWNQPHTLRGNRAVSGAQNMQFVSEEADDSGLAGGPNSVIELLDNRAAGFKKTTEQQRLLLTEIEEFVSGLEDKVVNKERDLNDRLNYGDRPEARAEEEREQQMQMLRYVFGEVQRELYEAADKISTTRDSIIQLGMLK